MKLTAKTKLTMTISRTATCLTHILQAFCSHKTQYDNTPTTHTHTHRHTVWYNWPSWSS